MKRFRKTLTITVVAVMLLNMSLSVFSAGNPSSSTWWPPGASLLEDIDDGEPVESNAWDKTEIQPEDKGMLGAAYLGNHATIMSPGEPAYKEMGDKIATVLKDNGYAVPENSRINPVGAFQVVKKSGTTGPYKLTVAFEEVELPSSGDQYNYGTILDMLSPSVVGQSVNVYALHYTTQQKWELLSSSVRLSELNHDNMRIAYGTMTADDLSPFYFFVVTNQLGTKAIQLEKAQSEVPQDKPVAPSTEMPKTSHKTGY